MSLKAIYPLAIIFHLVHWYVLGISQHVNARSKRNDSIENDRMNDATNAQANNLLNQRWQTNDLANGYDKQVNVFCVGSELTLTANYTCIYHVHFAEKTKI